jgi:hypothetical protein
MIKIDVNDIFFSLPLEFDDLSLLSLKLRTKIKKHEFLYQNQIEKNIKDRIGIKSEV